MLRLSKKVCSLPGFPFLLTTPLGCSLALLCNSLSYFTTNLFTGCLVGYLAKILTPEGGVQRVGASVALLAESKGEIAEVAARGGSSSSAVLTPTTSETILRSVKERMHLGPWSICLPYHRR